MNIAINLKDLDILKDELISHARDYSFAHGVMLRSSDGQFERHAPITLLPSPIPRHCFETMIKVQTSFNNLMHRVAHDHDFLSTSLKRTIQVDEFTRKLWDIYIAVKNEGIAQPISLGMNRSDYMVSGSSSEPLERAQVKQVEFNTMASGAGSLSQRLNGWHKYVFGVVGKPELAKQVADNRASDGLANAIVKAWLIYNQPKSVVLFLVHSMETNIYDQRLLEYSVHENNVTCRVIRRTLSDLQERGRLGDNKEFLIDGFEVAVVYQRSCYHPSHFRNEQDWATRLMVERSLAIKCPSIHYHLAGTKKVQQTLADPDVLKRFVDSEAERELIASTQVGLYSLDLDDVGDRNAAMAISEPHRYVMKPQREGGGNNVFGDDIATELKALHDSQERNAYILMERIRPLSFRNYIIKHGLDVRMQELISEVGIFGSFIGSREKTFHNEVHGYLFRSKTVDTNEGGLMSNTAALDSIYLV